MGKYKTATQMTSLAMLLVCMNGGTSTLVSFCAATGPWLLVVASVLTVYSFAIYFVGLWRFFK